MKFFTKHVTGVFLLLFMGITIHSYAQFTLSAELRPRAEFRHGFKSLRGDNDDPAFFIEQRTRLNADYEAEKYRLYISAQDIRMWGGTNQIYKSDGAMFNLYEAWGQYFLSDNISLKAGRQAIDYDNARFFGNLNWAQQGRSHDALLFLLEDNELKFHAGVAYNQDYNPTEPTHLFGTVYTNNNYKTMQYAWFHNNFEGVNLSVLFHNDGRQHIDGNDTKVVFRQTLGALGSMNFDNLEVGGEFYVQTGKNAADMDVSAFLLALNASLNTDIALLTAGFDYLSGTRLDDDKDKSFAPLYGTNHKFYGFMDYFYVGNNHGQTALPAGLIDPYVKAKFNFNEKHTLQMDVHHFFSGVKIQDPFNPDERLSSSSLGTEFDLVYGLQLADAAKLNIGYSTMAATESMEILKGGGNSDLTQHWAWAMLSINPTLFTTGKE